MENLHVFANDDDFTNWTLNAEPTFYTDETTGLSYYDYEYTQAYKDAVEAGKGFLIEDPNSCVCKRGCVCKGVINKPVQNLYRYSFDKVFS